MNVTYIHHSGFLVETEAFYYLFDYESGPLPEMDPGKRVLVLSSHSHADHYNPEVFSLLAAAGLEFQAILSEDIPAPEHVDTLPVSADREYTLGPGQALTTFRSTDLGVAFLIEDQGMLIYHAGDLNDWVWDEEPESYNREMTACYREQIRLLSEKLGRRQIDTGFLVLDPRQEKDYDRGLCYFLEKVSAKQVYPMHYWDDPSVIGRFLKDHPEHLHCIRNTE